MKTSYYILFILTLFFSCSKGENSEEIIEEPNNYTKNISLNLSETFQTVDGFGAGIKRQSNNLYRNTDAATRNKILDYCFKELEVNIIRFFVYSGLETTNDNNDPFVLASNNFDWTDYDSKHEVGQCLKDARDLSINGMDEFVGNANSAPSFLKTNGSFRDGGTLIPGGEDEYSEFFVGFIKGMKSRYQIDVTAISPTNEPDWVVKYESMNSSHTEIAGIVKNLKTRLNSEGMSDIKIVSPEAFRISSNNINTSAINITNRMFAVYGTKDAVDIVATHTYGNGNHDADWAGLKTAASNKPVWVTESAKLHSVDQSMTDAAHYIKWILNGFNKGGLTAYMSHLFYEKLDDDNGFSGLIGWKNGQIIIPKRYYTYKHFANLVKKGYKLIKTESTLSNVTIGSFKSPDGSKVILQVFNEGTTKDIFLENPIGTTHISHYITSNNIDENFSLQDDNLNTEVGQVIKINASSMSFHSVVYDIN